jgi:hypothetical protein
MKYLKLTIISILFVGVATAQFSQGSKTLGGGASYSSTTVGDADAVSTLVVAPSVGYFVMDNISANVALTMMKVGDADATTAYGFGARYYMGSMYGGGTYYGSTAEGDDGSLTFRGGYLMGLGDGGNFFLDLYGSYNMGLGDAEMSTIQVGAGFATFF